MARANAPIMIGEKPFMNYVSAVVANFSYKDIDSIRISARGRFISKAVDVSEIVTKRYLAEKVKTGKVTIDSEDFLRGDKKPVRVSVIDIELVRIEN